MDVDKAAMVVAEDEVAVPGVVTRDILVVPGFEQGSNMGQVFVLDGNIQVIVVPGLGFQQGIHSPAAVHPNIDTMSSKELDKFNNVVCGHFRSVVFHSLGERGDSDGACFAPPDWFMAA